MTIPAGYVCNQWGWFWKTSDNSGPYFLDRNGQMMQGFPSYLMTDNNGEFARLRVDVGQTNFFAGKTYRTFQKFTILAGASVAIRATTTVNLILQDISFTVEDSVCEITRRIGGTATGPWTAMPIFAMNEMAGAPVVPTQTVLEYDGAHSGGTITDLLRVVAGNKSSAASSAVSERGTPPGVKYWNIQNVGNQTAIVVFSAVWEERV